MSYRFYKTNKNVMQFDCKNEIHKIVFNHYIMRKVNLHRMKGDLPDGQFKITARGAAKDLNLSKATVSRLINEFESIGIVDVVKKSSVGKTCSIYEYITERKSKVMSKCEPLVETVCDTVDGTLKVSDFKDFGDFEVPKGKTDSETKSETFNIKNINKELNKNNIYTRIINYLNERAKKRFKSSTSKTISCINARFNEGFVEEDFYKVIDIKCSQWMDGDMEKFLRPETLFSNKFEGYLNEERVAEAEDLEAVEPYNIDFNF